MFCPNKTVLNLFHFLLPFFLLIFFTAQSSEPLIGESNCPIENQRLKINIITHKNGVGLSRDIEFLQKEFEKLGHSSQFVDVRNPVPPPKADINLFIEIGHSYFFPFATKNYFLPHPEWCMTTLENGYQAWPWAVTSVETIPKFDLILCKTKEAERIFKKLNPNTFYLGFTCEDRFDPLIKKDFKMPLHLGGASIQKGTDPLVRMWLQNPQFPQLVIIKHDKLNLFPDDENIRFMTEYLPDSELKTLQNSYGLHICPSETEGFGYNIAEALSCGNVVVTTDAPPMNECVLNCRCLVGHKHSEPWRLATRYFADPKKLEACIADLLSLSDAELQEIGKKNRELYLENDRIFRKKFAAIFNADAFRQSINDPKPLTIPIEDRQKSIGIFGYQDSRLQPWDPDSIKSGIVGSEEAIIYISQELADLGYKVTVFANPPKGSRYSSPEMNPRYLEANLDEGAKFDIAIAWRMPWKGVELRRRAKKVYLWPHDTSQGPMTNTQIDAFDDVLWLSEWQRKNWIDSNPGLEKFIKIFGNGINPDQFLPIQERKNPYACIYGSNYSRGLEIMLDTWPEIKKKFPLATLDIYYGWQHWGLLSPEKEAKMRAQVAALAALDVNEHGLVSHEALNRAYEKASFWTYPCILPETFCITALKAQLAGAIPVIIEGTALPETVKNGYKCCKAEDYCKTLTQAMETAEKATLEDRKKMGEFILKEFTWKAVACKWKELFEPFTNNNRLTDNNHAQEPIKSRKINIITNSNGLGLSKHLDILQRELTKLGHQVHFTEEAKFEPPPRADINIFIQPLTTDYLPYADKNYLIPCAEWCHLTFKEIAQYDLILCTTKVAVDIFKPMNPNTIYMGFTSHDCYNKAIPKNYIALLHFAGGSQQKGTAAVVKTWLNNPQFPLLNLIKHKGEMIYPSSSRIKLISRYIPQAELNAMQNGCGIHICPSETEGYGHYIMEALSCCSVVVTTDAPPMNEFVSDKRCLAGYHRISRQNQAINYYVDSLKLEGIVEDLLSLSEEELKEMGRKNREFYLESDRFFKQRLLEIFGDASKIN